MLDELKELVLQVSKLIPLICFHCEDGLEDSPVNSTLIWLVLKLSCGSSLPYTVCLFLWFTGRRRIQRPFTQDKVFLQN